MVDHDPSSDLLPMSNHEPEGSQPKKTFEREASSEAECFVPQGSYYGTPMRTFDREPLPEVEGIGQENLESLAGLEADAQSHEGVGYRSFDFDPASRIALAMETNCFEGLTPDYINSGEHDDEAGEFEEAEADGFTVIHDDDGLVMADISEGRPQNLKKRAASAAAIAGGTGLLVLHAPLVAVGMAGATAYAATRQDSAGSIARKVGDVGLQTADKAQTLAEEYRIQQRMGQAVGKVVSEKNKQKVTMGACAAASGLASATSSLSSWISNAARS